MRDEIGRNDRVKVTHLAGTEHGTVVGITPEGVYNVHLDDNTYCRFSPSEPGVSIEKA